MTASTTQIIVCAERAMLHRWPWAPKRVAFLRSYHRHLFKVRIGIQVKHNNREKEFFTVAAQLKDFLDGFPSKHTMSCEQLAEAILFEFFNATWCEVWEDGENGARVERPK
jgi:hypothetical protein